jgi:hypothetical protein
MTAARQRRKLPELLFGTPSRSALRFRSGSSRLVRFSTETTLEKSRNGERPTLVSRLAASMQLIGAHSPAGAAFRTSHLNLLDPRGTASRDPVGPVLFEKTLLGVGRVGHRIHHALETALRIPAM